jgi:hypothetical protein
MVPGKRARLLKKQLEEFKELWVNHTHRRKP